MKKHVLLLLILFLFKGSLFSQYFDWAVPVSGNNNNAFERGMTTDSAGNIYITASFGIGSTDVDPGPGTSIMSAPSNDNIYVAKIDPTGNLIWAKPFFCTGGCSGSTFPSAIVVDKLGNVYTSGFLYSTHDFDPGPGVVNSTGSAYISKLDASGNFVWAKFIAGTGGSTQIHGVAVDNAENVIVTGAFSYTTDFDPGAGVYNLTSAGGGTPKDIFILKMNVSGNFLWAKRIGESMYDQIGWNVSTDSLGNVYSVSTFPGTVDYDPGAGVNTLMATGNADICFLKLDPAGNYIWATQISGTSLGCRPFSIKQARSGNFYIAGTIFGSSYTVMFIKKLNAGGVLQWGTNIGNASSEVYAHSMDIDTAGNILVTGYFTNTVNFSPASGIANLTSAGQQDIFVAKYDSVLNFVWAKRVGAAMDDFGQSISIGVDNNIILFGVFSSVVDFDPGPAVYNLSSPFGEKLSLSSWSQDACSNFGVGIDSVYNVTCSGASGFSSGYAFNGVRPYSYTWNSSPPTLDSALNVSGSGLYTLTVTDSNGCINSSSSIVYGPLYSSNNDEAVNIIAGPFRPNISSYIYVDAFNNGCDSVSGQVSLVLDPMLIYNSSVPPPDVINGDTLIWNYSGLSYSTAHFVPKVSVTTLLSASIGDTVRLDALITPLAGDADLTNNSISDIYIVVNSYDPNDKHVNPKGACPQGYVLNNQKLTYTIRFQNTGSAEAINIIVSDSINASMDISTLKILASSYPAFAEITAGNVVKFHFDNINLPASMLNEPLSHGYIVFEIEPLSSLPNNTIVENTGYIYFDFNAPIVTNTVSNEFVNAIPSCVFTGIKELESETALLIYPNPGSEWIDIRLSVVPPNGAVLKMTDITGREVLTKSINKLESSVSVNVASFGAGVYLISVSTSKGIFIKK